MENERKGGEREKERKRKTRRRKVNSIRRIRCVESARVAMEREREKEGGHKALHPRMELD